MTSTLSAAQVDQYDKKGLITVTLPLEIRALQRAYLEEVCEWLVHWADFRSTPETLSGDLYRLAQTNRSIIAKLYKISRRFTSMKQLASHHYFIAMAKELMRTKLVSCCHFIGLRIDLPEEGKFLLDAHQDFPYIQGSLNGITVWMPFCDVELDMGAPSWIPESHTWGMLPVRGYRLDEVGGSGGKSFAIADQDRVQKEKFIRDRVAADQALVFHTLLLHRSEQNTSKKVRISVQLRFDDINDAASFERNYPEGLFLGEPLSASYPEYVIKND